MRPLQQPPRSLPAHPCRRGRARSPGEGASGNSLDGHRLPHGPRPRARFRLESGAFRAKGSRGVLASSRAHGAPYTGLITTSHVYNLPPTHTLHGRLRRGPEIRQVPQVSLEGRRLQPEREAGAAQGTSGMRPRGSAPSPGGERGEKGGKRSARADGNC